MKAIIVKMKSGHTYVVSNYSRGANGSAHLSGDYKQILPDGSFTDSKNGTFPYAGMETMFTFAETK